MLLHESSPLHTPLNQTGLAPENVYAVQSPVLSTQQSGTQQFTSLRKQVLEAQNPIQSKQAEDEQRLTKRQLYSSSLSAEPTPGPRPPAQG